MDLKKGDKIITLKPFRIFTIKYMIGNKVIVNNGTFDFPLTEGTFVPYSTLMEVLL